MAPETWICQWLRLTRLQTDRVVSAGFEQDRGINANVPIVSFEMRRFSRQQPLVSR
jgi:hypothetical protein